MENTGCVLQECIKIFHQVMNVSQQVQLRHAFNTTKGSSEGQGNADIDAVRNIYPSSHMTGADLDSGLDNAGKTTIVKKIMGEDINSVSPTLGFIIKTIDYEGQVFQDLLFRLTAKIT
jgi:hypothetical protein